MSDPKVMVLVGLLVAALFVLAIVAGGTRQDQFAVPDPEDPGALGSLEGLLHSLPGLGPGRSLEPGDLRVTRCGNGRDLEWNGTCTIVIPDDVGSATFQHPGGPDVTILLEQPDAVNDRFVLPRDLKRGRRPLRLFGDGGRLSLGCPALQTCRLRLVEGRG